MNAMNTGVGWARVGEWYVRWDVGELFQVTGYHGERHASLIESFDGETYEIDDDTWSVLPLAAVQPPDGWMPEASSAAREEIVPSDGAAAEPPAERAAEPEWDEPR